MPIPPSSILTSPAPDEIHQHTAMFFVSWSCQLVFNKILYSLIKPSRLRSSSRALRRFVMCNNKKKKLKVLTHGIVFFVILLTDSGSLIQRLSLLHLITLLWLPSLLATSIQLLPPTPMKTASVTLFYLWQRELTENI